MQHYETSVGGLAGNADCCVKAELLCDAAIFLAIISNNSDVFAAVFADVSMNNMLLLQQSS